MTKLSRRLVAVSMTVVAVVQLAGPAAGVLPGRQSPRGLPESVTLITGDRVVMRGGQMVEVRPGPGRAGMAFHQTRLGRRQNVIPLDALPLVASGAVDRRLFDVGLLAESGLDDARSPELPLLVEHAPGRSVRSTLPAGTRVTRELPLVDAVAIRQSRRTASQLWDRWTTRNGLAAGLERIRLDGGVKISLDRSVPQIGAPEAWRRGATGKGVKVAVLDTGYDAGHPDLAGAVVGERDLTSEGTLTDHHGHGTHVASTIAGSGAASQGRRKGVAPDADLLIGKVCDRYGRCAESDIIAGMQWATEQGARVVNMSLGGWPTDGTDPMSEAVNELTARTGALFVVAAGNSGGAGGETVGTPASADAALAVGSVTKSDQLSPFSSRGPRFGDLALKPELTAPGSRIVAARAAGKLDPFAVDKHYAELSGTSMASPHVAGAAAIVAQGHPGWKATELRSVLTGSSHPLAGLGVYEQGAGRVDVARAVGQLVSSVPAAANLGTASFPHHDDEPLTSKVSYRNDGKHPVALRLRLRMNSPDGRPAPGGMFRLSTSRLIVPAGGTATVVVTADTTVAGPDGAYGGWLVAENGSTVVRTTVGVNKEVPSYDVTFRMLDRTGQPARLTERDVPYLDILNVDRKYFDGGILEDGSLTLRLRRGTYALTALLGVMNEGVDGYRDVTYFPEPSLVVDRDTELLLDGRRANQVRMRRPVADASLATAGIGYARRLKDVTFISGTAVLNPMRHDAKLDLYVAPNRTGDRDEFTGFGHAFWARMPANPRPDRDFFLNSPYLYHDVAHRPGLVPVSLVTDPAGYARVDATYPTSDPGTVGNRWGFAVLPGSYPGGDVGAYIISPTAEMTLPVRRTEYYSVRGGLEWTYHFQAYRYLNDETPEIQETALVLGPDVGLTTTDRWGGAVTGPNFPSPAVGAPAFRQRQPWVFRDGDSLTVNAPMFADAGPGRIGDGVIETERTTLHRNGEQIAESDTKIQQTFTMPADAATYRLAKQITRPADHYRLSTRITADWTFRSQRTPDDSATALPLLTVRYAPELDDRNRAPAGRFELPVRVVPQHGSRSGPIPWLTVEASYDEGTTWHRLPVRRTGTDWTATLDQPGHKLVSLRARSADSAGNEVEQTIIRAYEVA